MLKTSLFSYIKTRFKEHKSNSIIICAYFIFSITSSIVCFSLGSTRNGFLSLLFSSFALLVYIIEYFLKIRFVPLFLTIILSLAIGAQLGTCYDFYNLIPVFDTILHGIAGLIFACLGYPIALIFFGKPTTKRHFYGCIAFSIFFSLSIAVIWEIFEYGMNSIFGYDMLEDTMINSFNSYYLSGSHNEDFWVNDITKTIIEFDNGKILILDGYIDIGLIDTLSDMIICFIGSIFFFILTTISYLKFPKLNKALLPTICEKQKEL